MIFDLHEAAFFSTPRLRSRRLRELVSQKVEKDEKLFFSFLIIRNLCVCVFFCSSNTRRLRLLKLNWSRCRDVAQTNSWLKGTKYIF